MTDLWKYPICAYRMAIAEWQTRRMTRSWKRNGDAFLRDLVATMPGWPPFKQRWREWLDAYDKAAARAALEADRD